MYVIYVSRVPTHPDHVQKNIFSLHGFGQVREAGGGQGHHALHGAARLLEGVPSRWLKSWGTLVVPKDLMDVMSW